MWVRKEAAETLMEVNKPARENDPLRKNPFVALFLALAAVFFQAPGCSSTMERSSISWSDAIGRFILFFLVLYAVQLLFGAKVVTFLASNSQAWGLDEPQDMVICPGCKRVEARLTKDVCPACGQDLEPLTNWKWRDEET